MPCPAELGVQTDLNVRKDMHAHHYIPVASRICKLQNPHPICGVHPTAVCGSWAILGRCFLFGRASRAGLGELPEPRWQETSQSCSGFQDPKTCDRRANRNKLSLHYSTTSSGLKSSRSWRDMMSFSMIALGRARLVGLHVEGWGKAVVCWHRITGQLSHNPR